MRIDGVGANPWPTGNPTPVRPPAPPAPAPAAPVAPVAAAVTTAAQQQQSIAAQVLQQAEQHKGGGGGGGHGHSKNLKAIEDLAARATLRIEPRGKTVIERLAEIERLKAAQKAAAEKVGATSKDDGQGQQGKHEEPAPEQGEEQPADS